MQLTAGTCIHNGKKQRHCSTAPLSQGQFHNGFSMVIPLGPFLSQLSEFGTKSCLRMRQKIHKIIESTKSCRNCMRNPTGAVPLW